MRKTHNPLEGELKDLVQADLQSGIKRGKVCEKHNVSYIQLQKTFGFTCKKPRNKPEPVAEPA